MATCIDVVGAEYLKTFNNNTISPYEGISLVPAFNNEKVPDRPIFWEHEGNKAVRLGKYKLVSRYTKEAEYNWELYDLEADRSETNNLLSQMPEKANELEILWKSWAKRVGVLTWKDKQVIE